MAAIAIATGHLRETLSYAAAVILHEFSHASVAARLGYTLNTLKIMPYGAALTGEFETVKRRDEFLIAIAGPLSNVVFAIAFIAVWWLVPQLFYYTEIYVTANVFTALVNLLPVFPLDGGRAMLALVSGKVPRRKAYTALRAIGLFVGVSGVVLAVIFFRSLNFSYFTFLIFVLASAIFPDKSASYQRLYGMANRMEMVKRGLPVREIMIGGDLQLYRCMRMLSAEYYTRFTVVDDSFEKVGAFDETKLESLLARYSASSSVSDALKGEKSPSVGARNEKYS